jgi:hypothetical protein
MLTALGFLTAAAGLFLLLWYRTVVSLPAQVRPAFVLWAPFKWGLPLLAVLVFLAGLYLAALTGAVYAIALLAASALLVFLALRFDRYSAQMRLIVSRYRDLREADPAMEEIELLFLIARWRYPKWGHDRLVELVAGKNIRELVLLMMVQENGINPLRDWELYRSLRSRAARITELGE